MLVNFICLILFSNFPENKTDLLCRKWRQVGIKSFGQEYKAVDLAMSEMISINKNGSYVKVLYGSLEIKGQWKFNSDSTKLAFTVAEFNGVMTPNLSPGDANPTDSIIKLTTDTLIYGALTYYGEDKIYGHDDWYFVREK